MENNSKDIQYLDFLANISDEEIIAPFYAKNYHIILLYIPVILLAFFANVVVIVIVTKYHYMQSVTNYFLVNLSIADLLVTLVCMPMACWDAYTMLWNFGEATCKISKFLQGVSVAASVFTITTMAIDRYLAITQPFGVFRRFSKKSTVITISMLWIMGMILFLPLLFVGQLSKNPITPRITLVFCQEYWDDFYISRELFGTICYVMMFVVPGFIMLCAYALMGKKLCSVMPPFDDEGVCSTQQSFRLVKERRRVAWILLCLALVFAICWLPYNTVNLVKDYKNVRYSTLLKTIFDQKRYMLLLGHTNSALNPIIYCMMSRNFRRSVKELICSPKFRFPFRRSRRMQCVNSTCSTNRYPNRFQLKPLSTVHNQHQPLNRLQSSQKTTKTCAV